MLVRDTENPEEDARAAVFLHEIDWVIKGHDTPIARRNKEAIEAATEFWHERLSEEATDIKFIRLTFTGYHRAFLRQYWCRFIDFG
jgi:hypothetical protein